jgi:hypothetical protein
MENVMVLHEAMNTARFSPAGYSLPDEAYPLDELALMPLAGGEYPTEDGAVPGLFLLFGDDDEDDEDFDEEDDFDDMGDDFDDDFEDDDFDDEDDDYDDEDDDFDYEEDVDYDDFADE